MIVIRFRIIWEEWLTSIAC